MKGEIGKITINPLQTADSLAKFLTFVFDEIILDAGFSV